MNRCLVIWVWWVLLLAGCGAENEGRVRPNIVLITLDTVRADHLSCYGAGNSTPAIDRMAKDGVRFEMAVSASPWTLPAHASLFTGLPVSQHGARYDVQGDEGINLHRIRSLGRGPTTLSSLLTKAGYHTMGAVAGVWMQPQFGLARGFGEYEANIESWAGVPAEELTATAFELLDERPPDRPFFLFLNYFDAHLPHDPPALFNPANIPPPDRDVKLIERDVNKLDLPISADERQRLEGRYDAEIRRIDAALGRLWERLETLDLYDDTWIIVTADHGESFGDHGFMGHGLQTWHGLAHVPLLMKPHRGAPWSDLSGQSIEVTVQSHELMPTILDALRLERPPDVQGRDLTRLSDRQEGMAVVEAFRSYNAIKVYGPRFDRDERSLYTEGYRYVRRSTGEEALYDVRADPREEHDLSGAEPARKERMAKALTGWTIAAGRRRYGGEIAPIDEENAARLRALGYLD